MKNDTEKLDNIRFIQYLNRRILEEAEEAILGELPGDRGDGVQPEQRRDDNTVVGATPEQLTVDQKKRVILKRRNRMWGIKNPIIWILEKIADTELKIAKAQPPELANDPQTPMDEKDIALMRDYVNRN
jgi:hypothetical protein